MYVSLENEFIKNQTVSKLLRHNIKAYRVINFLSQTFQLTKHATEVAI